MEELTTCSSSTGWRTKKILSRFSSRLLTLENVAQTCRFCSQEEHLAVVKTQ